MVFIRARGFMEKERGCDSGGGNFAKTAKVPVQMRKPEDLPDAVFAAAGIQRDLSRTPFSNMGPVEWKTSHYHDGLVV